VRLDQPSSLVLRSIKSELDGTPDPRVMANAAPALTAEQQAADDAAKEAAAAAARAAAARRTARAPQRETSGPKRQQRSVFISAGGGI
jgi:hypothetical protein